MDKGLKQTILVVDDAPENIDVISGLLNSDYRVKVALNGEKALQIVADALPDLILLDIIMPVMDGYEVCRRLKENDRTAKIPVIFVTSMEETRDETLGFDLGAADYITKPVSPPVVLSRVKTHLALYDQQRYLEEMVRQRTSDLQCALKDLSESREKLKEGYIDTIHRLTVVSEYKDEETTTHVRRVGLYCAMIAEQFGFSREDAEVIAYAAPMHDIGKVGIPSAILLKRGRLTPQEFALMETHTMIGGNILNGSGSIFIKAADKIALSHHERWDGSGYPKGLKGEEIPVEARIMNISDQYDALRSLRPYKPPFEHERVFKIITEGDGRTMPGHFDPAVLEAFRDNHQKFNEIYEAHID